MIQWLLRSMRMQGIDDVLVVALGKENRGQTKSLVASGSNSA